MERPNILGKTRDTITKFKPGSVFSASDFSDISDSAKIGVTLSRLEKEGLIKKYYMVFMYIRNTILFLENVSNRILTMLHTL